MRYLPENFQTNNTAIPDMAILLAAFLIMTAWFINTFYPKITFSLFNDNSVSSSSTTAQTDQPVKIVTEEAVTVNAVKQVGPSVVTVVQVGPPDDRNPDYGPYSFFSHPDDQPAQDLELTIGSGFIVSESGIIVTNKHVVSGTSSNYQIITEDDEKYDVKTIFRDPRNDIALLRIDPGQNPGKQLKAVTLGDSSNLQVGQFVIAIGTALGQFRNTVTTGVISGLGRGITANNELMNTDEQLNNVIQTSAAINLGNSGGPLLDYSGNVIGMNTAIAVNGQNIGFALPVNEIKADLNSF